MLDDCRVNREMSTNLVVILYDKKLKDENMYYG